MTTPAASALISARPRPTKLTFRHMLASEWIKLTSLPIVPIALGGMVAAGLAGALFLALTAESAGLPSVPSVENTIREILTGFVVLGQIIAGIIGVMAIGSEYASGSIHTTLIAAPKRLQVLGAKAVVVFVLVTVVSLMTAFGLWALVNPIYDQWGLGAAITAPGVLPALLGTGAYMGLSALLGLGVGTLLRSTTAGSIVMFVVTLLAPILVSVLPFGDVSRWLRVLMFGNAGDAMTRALVGGAFLNPTAGQISYGAGWLIVVAWVVTAMLAAAVVLRRRDA